MGRREREQQKTMWMTTDSMAKGPGPPFYVELNRLLARSGFDTYAEDLCERFYVAGNGRPSVAPGVYFRMLLIGYFEGIGSERGIAWRSADSLGLREFLGYGPDRATPDHSTLSVIRNRLDEKTHQAIFDWVLKVLKEQGLVKGKTIGIDATTLEANAAMRSGGKAQGHAKAFEAVLAAVLSPVLRLAAFIGVVWRLGAARGPAYRQPGRVATRDADEGSSTGC